MPLLQPHLELDRCPHCSVARPLLASFYPVQESKNHTNNRRGFWQAYCCKTCGGVVLAFSPAGPNQPITEMYPDARKVDEAIPDRAKRFLTQAIDSIVAPDGAVMLAASAVDAMLKEKGYKEGSLYARIEKAKNEHLITDDMAEWAHKVRLDANEQRHADDDAPPATPEDAEQSIEFASALGQFMFVLPARIKRGLEEAD